MCTNKARSPEIKITGWGTVVVFHLFALCFCCVCGFCCFVQDPMACVIIVSWSESAVFPSYRQSTCSGESHSGPREFAPEVYFKRQSFLGQAQWNRKSTTETRGLWCAMAKHFVRSYPEHKATILKGKKGSKEGVPGEKVTDIRIIKTIQPQEK